MLKDKVALITGASRGIGRAIAIKLAENGAICVINYNGSEDKALETKAEIEKIGGTAVVAKANVANFEQCEQMIKDVIEQFGKIDILINNAGITKDGLMLKMTEKDFDDVLDINLKGTFNCTKLASKYMMKKRTGAIVNVSSVAGVMGNMGQVNYSASKAGVIGLTKSAARELARRNIRVNAIAPGFIETEMTDILPQEVKDAGIKQVPLARFGTVEEVANVVLFLASENSSYLTGQVLKIDGGMIM